VMKHLDSFSLAIVHQIKPFPHQENPFLTKIPVSDSHPNIERTSYRLAGLTHSAGGFLRWCLCFLLSSGARSSLGSPVKGSGAVNACVFTRSG
jgi:hypothetical protein